MAIMNFIYFIRNRIKNTWFKISGDYYIRVKIFYTFIY